MAAYSSMSIHYVTDVALGSGPVRDNANALSIKIDAGGGGFSLTLFGLSDAKADALADALRAEDMKAAFVAGSAQALIGEGV